MAFKVTDMASEKKIQPHLPMWDRRYSNPRQDSIINNPKIGPGSASSLARNFSMPSAHDLHNPMRVFKANLAKERQRLLSNEAVNACIVSSTLNNWLNGSNCAGRNLGLPSRMALYKNVNVSHNNNEARLYESTLSDMLVQQYAPTEERLKLLGSQWLNLQVLQKLLLYCKPFTIAFQEPEISTRSIFKSFSLWPRRIYPPQINQRQTMKLIRIDQLALFEYLSQDDNWNCFSSQVSRAWPTTFGRVIVREGKPCFLWQLDALNLDTGTSYVCRRSVLNGDQPLLEGLFHGFDVYLHPSDDLLWQIMPNISISILTMPTIAFLESLFAPNHTTSNGFGTLGNWFPIQSTTPLLHSTGDFANGDWFCIRFNICSCIPDEGGRRVKRFKHGYGIFPESIGIPLKRQAARLPGFSRAGDQFAVEFLISVSLVMRKSSITNGPSVIKYTVTAWLDYDTELDGLHERGSLLPALSGRVDRDLDLKDCGAGAAGFLQFLVVLIRAIDHWRRCWDAMMTKIDDMVSIQLQDTLDRDRWQELMFDDSFQLSEQYFTVLQLLRVFQDWIGETEDGIEGLSRELIGQFESWQDWRHQYCPRDENVWPLDIEHLEANFEKVKSFFTLRANLLKERIRRKKDEVESLRDGLFNASSLREALKAKMLNMFIGAFTVVTVIYTPLSFMATFWAIPVLTPNSQTTTPSGFATSFVFVPMATYILSAVFIIWVWSRSSSCFTMSLLAYTWVVTGSIFKNTTLMLNQLQGFLKKVKRRPSDQEANNN
ncbi:hypothetical protein F5B20DRAFT_559174 [Whalleya microplaca]|nr:hypothetical protein F5B20DRAFT_559174 [Whalleya microplaca]